MAEPVNPILIWAEQDVTLPGLDGANKTLPLIELSGIGWDKGQKPAADEFNYILNNYGEWLQWHEDSKAPLTDFANSLTTNGYQKLPGGLILQWVTFTTNVTNGADTNVSWPIAFPTGIFAVTCSFNEGVTADITTPLIVKSSSTTGATFVSWTGLGNGARAIAIGY